LHIFKYNLQYKIGPTPISRILRYVLREKQLEIQERKLLILIATDGVPTNDHGQQDTKSFEYALRHDRKPIDRVPVTIIACTDDNDCIGYVILLVTFSDKLFFLFYSYLNNWDKRIPNLDVADDYRSERQEILKVQGKEFPFSFGDVCQSIYSIHVLFYLINFLFFKSMLSKY
jgi:hypothetical protein